MKVIVIEVNLSNMKLIMEILETEGYEYLQAEDTLTGTELASKEFPDIFYYIYGYTTVDSSKIALSDLPPSRNG